MVDYKDELAELYRRLKPIFAPNAERLIDSVVSPLSNSINEKCARIRAAFVQRFDERIARQYIITGSRGEPKKILLDRTLVEWQPTASE